MSSKMLMCRTVRLMTELDLLCTKIKDPSRIFNSQGRLLRCLLMLSAVVRMKMTSLQIVCSEQNFSIFPSFKSSEEDTLST